MENKERNKINVLLILEYTLSVSTDQNVSYQVVPIEYCTNSALLTRIAIQISENCIKFISSLKFLAYHATLAAAAAASEAARGQAVGAEIPISLMQ